MKKMLLIGELNQTVGSVNKYLSTQFQTQICLDSLEMVKGMMKVFDADIAVICLVGVGELDNRILDFFNGRNVPIPVLLIGTQAECEYYQKYYEDSQFDYVVRPTTLAMLQQKCFEMLRVGEKDENSKTEANTQEVLVPKRMRILAVDDSGILLRNVKAMLETTYDVAVANSGMVAIKQAKKKIPDLILLDYEMPEWDGRKTLEEIRNDVDLKDVPVVFLTAVADKSHISAVLELRPSGYLLKPIEQKRLFDTIERALIRI